MTDLVTPGPSDGAVESTPSGHAWWKASEAWIVDGADLATVFSAVDETQLNAFAHTATNGLTLTIAAGEAYIAGWLCRDRATDVDLPENATTTIYLGYNTRAVLTGDQVPADVEDVVIGPEGDFNPEDPRIPIFTATTDGTSTVEPPDDHRKTEQPIEYDHEAGVVTASDPIHGPDGALASQSSLDSHAGDAAAHHTRYDDPEAIAAIEAAASLSLSGDVDTPGYIDADTRVSSSYFRLRGSRFHYDPDLSGTATHFQRDSVTSETAMTFVGTSVGIHETTTPQAPVHLGGNTRIDGDVDTYGLVDNSGGDGLQPPDIAGGSLPSGTRTGRIVYDSSREQ